MWGKGGGDLKCTPYQQQRTSYQPVQSIVTKKCVSNKKWPSCNKMLEHATSA